LETSLWGQKERKKIPRQGRGNHVGSTSNSGKGNNDCWAKSGRKGRTSARLSAKGYMEKCDAPSQVEGGGETGDLSNGPPVRYDALAT